jgi:hypothetical protein
MTNQYTTTFEKTAPRHWYSTVRHTETGAGWTFGPFKTKKHAGEYATDFISRMDGDK